jgi:hypothetical protein
MHCCFTEAPPLLLSFMRACAPPAFDHHFTLTATSFSPQLISPVTTHTPFFLHPRSYFLFVSCTRRPLDSHSRAPVVKQRTFKLGVGTSPPRASGVASSSAGAATAAAPDDDTPLTLDFGSPERLAAGPPAEFNLFNPGFTSTSSSSYVTPPLSLAHSVLSASLHPPSTCVHHPHASILPTHRSIQHATRCLTPRRHDLSACTPSCRPQSCTCDPSSPCAHST